MDWSSSENVDIRTLLRSLRDNKVQFLVVGAWAIPAYGRPRMTNDVDVFIKPTKENAKRTIKALLAIGYAAAQDVPPVLFLKKKVLFRQYVLQVDIHPFVKGVSFVRAWKNRKITTISGCKVFVPSLDDLIAMKKAAGRSKDREDIKELSVVKKKLEIKKRKPKN